MPQTDGAREGTGGKLGIRKSNGDAGGHSEFWAAERRLGDVGLNAA